MKKLLALVLSLVMVLSLTACGGGKDYSGTYKVTAVKSDDIELKKGDELWKTAFPDDSSLPYIELKKDDKCTISFDDDNTDGKYSVDGDKITITADKEDVKGTIKDGKITLTIEGAEMVFEKK
jgi:hypothetical protein